MALSFVQRYSLCLTITIILHGRGIVVLGLRQSRLDVWFSELWVSRVADVVIITVLKNIEAMIVMIFYLIVFLNSR